MAATPSLVWPAARQLSSEGRDCGVAGLSEPARTPAGHRGLAYPAYAEGHDGDESSASSPYSPDLNPDELVWNHLKTHTVGRTTTDSKQSFRGKVLSSMRS